MTKENWLDELEDTIDDQTPQLRPVVKSDQDKLTLPLFLLFLVVSVGLVGAYVWKKNSTYATRYQPNVITQSPSNGPNYNYRSYQKDVDEVRKATEKVWDKTKWNTDKMRLIAVINNHNTAVVKNNYAKSDLIYINEDWTINRLPNHLNLSEDDKEWLRNNHMRQRVSTTESGPTAPKSLE